MAERLIISISGMRGIIGENLSPAIAAEYGCAFGTFLKEKEGQNKKISVCIGRDSRPSGLMLTSAVASGLAAAGVDVIDLGIVTTPGVGVMTVKLGSAGGVIITASHNPIEYNGIKLLLGDGIAPEPKYAEKIKKIFEEKTLKLVSSIECGKISVCENTDPVHIEKVLSTVNLKTIVKKNFKVVLDSVNGAGGRAGKILLEKLGCNVITVNYEPTGIFAHKPEPTKENLVSLCDIVKQHKADIGFAQDPDADRLAIVDENGVYIGEEYTLALACLNTLSKNKTNTAANLSTSRMIDDIAAKFGAKVFRTPVGEANVAKAMKENDCLIGGEGNGGVIDLRVGPIRNSLLSMAVVLELMADKNKTASQLVNEIPAYSMIKEKFAVTPQQVVPLLDEAKKEFPNAVINDSDGYRFDFADSWFHLRMSNTEPIMRVIAEANNQKTACLYIEKVMEIKQRIFGGK